MGRNHIRRGQLAVMDVRPLDSDVRVGGGVLPTQKQFRIPVEPAQKAVPLPASASAIEAASPNHSPGQSASASAGNLFTQGAMGRIETVFCTARNSGSADERTQTLLRPLDHRRKCINRRRKARVAPTRKPAIDHATTTSPSKPPSTMPPKPRPEKVPDDCHASGQRQNRSATKRNEVTRHHPFAKLDRHKTNQRNHRRDGDVCCGIRDRQIEP